MSVLDCLLYPELVPSFLLGLLWAGLCRYSAARRGNTARESDAQSPEQRRRPRGRFPSPPTAKPGRAGAPVASHQPAPRVVEYWIKRTHAPKANQ